MKEEIMFVMFKDTPLNNKETFWSKSHKILNEEEINRVYKRIVNYQVEKYGRNLYDKYDLMGSVRKSYLANKLY